MVKKTKNKSFKLYLLGEDVKLKNVIGFDMLISANDLELLDKLDHAAEKGESGGVLQEKRTCCLIL